MSIRRRLTLTILGGLLAVWIVCGTALYGYMRFALTREFDARAADQARAFAAFTEYQESDYREERTLRLNEVPEDIQAVVREHAAVGDVEEIERVIRDGRVFYKVEAKHHGLEREFLVSGVGDYLGELDEFAFAYSRAGLPEFQPGPNASYFQVWDDDGETIAKSPSLDTNALISYHDARRRAAFDINLPDGRAGRVLVSAFTPPGGDEALVLALARSRAGLDRTLWILLSTIVVGGCTVAAVSAWLVRRNVREGLAPLETFAREADAIEANDLSHRFSAADLPLELRPIARQLNDLLGRLDSAFAREKRFTSDVAHELRTPIAELRALTEVGMDNALDQEGLVGEPQYFRDALDIALQMERLVDRLLILRRSESGNLAIAFDDVDLTALATRAWKPFEPDAKARSLHASFDLPLQANLRTDPALLSSILTNVYANAVAYTPVGGRIDVNLRSENGSWRFDLSNTNAGLEPEDVARMNEPFWRKDAARGDSNHAGLGLTIVTSFAKLLGAEFSAVLDREGTVRVSLSHPKNRSK